MSLKKKTIPLHARASYILQASGHFASRDHRARGDVELWVLHIGAGRQRGRHRLVGRGVDTNVVVHVSRGGGAQSVQKQGGV